jgi:hypothetical protein
MKELLFELLRIIALIACIALPIWAFLNSEDGEEM